jgi:hypothetical protein
MFNRAACLASESESAVTKNRMNLQRTKIPRASQHEMGWKAQQTFPLLPVAGEPFPLTFPFNRTLVMTGPANFRVVTRKQSPTYDFVRWLRCKPNQFQSKGQH